MGLGLRLMRLVGRTRVGRDLKCGWSGEARGVEWSGVLRTGPEPTRVVRGMSSRSVSCCWGESGLFLAGG